jgi:hypothetical protein
MKNFMHPWTWIYVFNTFNKAHLDLQVGIDNNNKL